MSVLLSLQDVSADLGRTRVLQGVSLNVGGGEIISILGPNGAGKTSLMRAALGLIGATGETRLGGADPRTLTARERALRAAYLPQRPQSIWPIKVEVLVALGRFAHGAVPDRLAPADQAAVDSAIKACSLSEFRHRGMDELSGGEKARAHLARTLAQHAPLLLLDEPTAGLDPAQSLGVAEILEAHAAAGGAAVFSTHDIALAASVADRVVLMKAGAIIAEGAPEEALTASVLEAAYGRAARLEWVGDTFAAVFDR